MTSPSPAPNLIFLHAELARAELQVTCDEMIDNYNRRQVELAKSMVWRDRVKGQIARIQESL